MPFGFATFLLVGYSVQLLLNHHEGIVFHDTFTNLHTDSSYLTCLFGLQGVGHLHGFEHDNGVAYLNFVANSHLDIGDNARQRSLDGVVLVDGSLFSSGSIIAGSGLFGGLT